MKTLKELWELRIVVKDLYNFIYKHCPEYREWLEKNYEKICNR